MSQFSLEDLRRGDTSKLSISDQMSLEFGGSLSAAGRQFMSDAMSLELGGPLSADANTLVSNDMSRELGVGSIRPLRSDSIYTE